MTARLLLIDDDDAARRMMRRVLKRRGYEVEDVDNGRAGLDRVRESPPAGVLLDLRMPGELSGFDVARELKADPDTRGVPVIVVSASTYLDARSMVEQVGCDAFVEKPVDFDDLDRVLDEFIPR